MLRTYYFLTKPGIIRGNAITATAGFLLASKGNINWTLFLAMLGGLSLIVASACVFNNYIDREIDAKMVRTKKRALVSGIVSGQDAILFASILGIAGGVILTLLTNFLALVVAMTGFFFYVVVYGYFKRRTSLGTVIGSISGAVPPVVGYVAVSGSFDSGALIIFLILVFWQMPHFYSIAIYRLKEYRAAGIPVLPLKKGIKATKVQMLLYIAAFIFAVASLTVFDYTGYVYLVVALLLGLAWLWLCLKGFNARDDNKWARGMFKFSLVVITVLSVTISIDSWLP